MYAELLNRDCTQTVYTVIDNLCEKTKNELIQIFGNDYKDKTFETIKDTEIFVIKLKANDKPVGLFGLIPQKENSAGIYLLTTDELHDGNIITFLKGAKKQIKTWAKKYKLLMDTCNKQNDSIQKWLNLLGFQPSQYQDENFQIYCLGDINLYE